MGIWFSSRCLLVSNVFLCRPGYLYKRYPNKKPPNFSAWRFPDLNFVYYTLFTGSLHSLGGIRISLYEASANQGKAEDWMAKVSSGTISMTSER